MEEIKKIIAKAAYGQGIKSFRREIHLNTDERKKPTEILGIVVTNAAISGCTLEGNRDGGKAVRVKGTYDVHLWYALNGDTKSVKTGAKFSDVIIVSGQGGENYSNEEARAWIQKAPQSTGTSVAEGAEGSGVTATVEYVLGAEVVGQTALNVKVINSFDVSDEIDDFSTENGETLDEYEDD